MLKLELLTVLGELSRGSKLVFSDTEAFKSNFILKAIREILLHNVQVNVVVGTLGTGKAWLD